MVLLFAGLTIYLFNYDGVVKSIFDFHVFVLSATVALKDECNWPDRFRLTFLVRPHRMI